MKYVLIAMVLVISMFTSCANPLDSNPTFGDGKLSPFENEGKLITLSYKKTNIVIAGTGQCIIERSVDNLCDTIFIDGDTTISHTGRSKAENMLEWCFFNDRMIHVTTGDTLSTSESYIENGFTDTLKIVYTVSCNDTIRF